MPTSLHELDIIEQSFLFFDALVLHLMQISYLSVNANPERIEKDAQ
jgi:hypothetical protein